MLRNFVCWPFLLLAATSQPLRLPIVLVEAKALYDEDALVPRPIAAVTAHLVADGGHIRLRVTVSAVGLGIEPVPGFAGTPDANRRTAEELDRLLAAGAMQWVTRRGAENEAGQLVAVERGELPARHIDAAGNVSATTTEASLVRRVTFESAPLPASTSCGYLLSEGVPRLCVQVDNTGDTYGLTIESMGEPAPPGHLKVRR